MADSDSESNEERFRGKQTLTTHLWVYFGILFILLIITDILNIAFSLQLAILAVSAFLLYLLLLRPYRKEFKEWGKPQPDDS